MKLNILINLIFHLVNKVMSSIMKKMRSLTIKTVELQVFFIQKNKSKIRAIKEKYNINSKSLNAFINTTNLLSIRIIN